MLAVIVVSPGPRVVANPEELMVATAVLLEVQVTWPVMSCLGGMVPPLPRVYIPIALNCTELPVAGLAVGGLTRMALSTVGGD